MVQGFSVTGINHKFAPLSVRELVAFAPERLPLALRELREKHKVEQCVILSTCNRVEIVAFEPPVSDDAESDTLKRVTRFLAEFHRVEATTLAPHLYHHRGSQAIEHLMRVAASLDSLVLGETQILAQVKDAYALAAAEGASGKALNALMHRAFTVAKEVHSETAIGRGRLSVPSVAVSLIKRTFEELSSKTALLIGLGEMGELTLTHLREAGIGTVIIANRTHQRAEEVAKTFGGEAIPLSLLGDYLPRADIVVSQTASPSIIVTVEMVRGAMKQRGHRPMFMVDLAVPRDIHPEVERIDGVYRYEIDDLERVVAEASEARSAELERGLAIVERHAAAFARERSLVNAEPVISAIKERASKIVEEEVAKSMAAAGRIGPDAEALLRQVSQRIANRLLHQPIQGVKDAARAGDPQSLEVARKLLAEQESVAPSAKQEVVTEREPTATTAQTERQP